MENHIKSLTPTFKPLYIAIKSLFLGIAMFLPVLFFTYDIIDINLFSFGLIFILIASLVYFLWIRETYKMSKFHFYEDRILFLEGFLNTSEKEVLYKNIREVNLTKNILQRLFNIGTIKLINSATTAEGKQAGIVLPDIESPNTAYEEIKKIVRNSN